MPEATDVESPGSCSWPLPSFTGRGTSSSAPVRQFHPPASTGAARSRRRRDVLASHGARLCSDSLVIRYTSCDGSSYFKLGDFADRRPEALADAIRQAFPQLMLASIGPDAPHARWFDEMLKLTDPDHLPHAGADWDAPGDHLPASAGWANNPSIRLPLPPPATCIPTTI